MKKVLTKPFLIILLAVVLLISFFTIAFISLSDEIISSEKNLIAKTMLFHHETKKGEEIEIPFSINSKMMGEDLYLINVILNDNNGANYNVKNGRFKISLDNSVEIPMMCYSAGGSNYYIPSISYLDDQQTFECSTDNGYLYLNMLLSGEEAENLKVTVNYSIIGKGVYSFNKFYGFEETFGLNDFI